MKKRHKHKQTLEGIGHVLDCVNGIRGIAACPSSSNSICAVIVFNMIHSICAVFVD